MATYTLIVDRMLEIIERALESGAKESSLPWLAQRVSDLSALHGAYDLITTSPTEILATDGNDDVVQAAELLQGAELLVREAEKGSPNFLVDVGLGGSIGGTLKCTPTLQSDRVHLAYGHHGTPTNPDPVRDILSALRFSELSTVYFESGHAINSDAIWVSFLADSSFPGWKWCDFSGFNICKEKPQGASAGPIHASIGMGNDDSLFGWLVQQLKTGFLTCDDGPGEVADFIHLDNDDTLSLIHVKSSSSPHPNRKVAAQRYEVVVSQAMKNLPFVDTTTLIAALDRPRTYLPATWLEGVRTDNRNEMIEYLRERSPGARTRVVVLQPHVRESGHQDEWNRNTKRVRLLDTLLNSARGSVTGLGAEFEVWGASG